MDMIYIPLQYCFMKRQIRLIIEDLNKFEIANLNPTWDSE